MKDRQKILGEYCSLTLSLLDALDERDFERVKILEKKRALYDLSLDDGTYFIRKMQEHILDGLYFRKPSWIEAMLAYQELLEGSPIQTEGLQFLWRKPAF
ncbi:MAG: hypothetical protein FJ161_05075 [Gammaproteobacteria bacterium]|nr:hypothetical protein [Gammaproteobacteria bacterium]